MFTRKKAIKYEKKMFALIDEHDKLVVAKSETDDEQTVMIHATRRRAHAERMRDERVVECYVTWTVKR